MVTYFKKSNDIDGDGLYQDQFVMRFFDTQEPTDGILNREVNFDKEVATQNAAGLVIFDVKNL